MNHRGRSPYVACALIGVVVIFTFKTPAQTFAPGETLHIAFESPSELLADFVSQNEHYAQQGRESLTERALSIGEGRFGNGLYIEDGSPKSAGTWNQSGLDCDLIVSVVWGEWRKKPHYWGAGHFYGDRGTVTFWVKGEAAHRGVLFMQGSIGWGRKERDLFTVEVDDDGRLHAHLRDVNSVYHRVKADRPTWTDGEWHHVAVSYDQAYGMKLYHDGQLVGSTWGEGGWWQAPLPGLFSPFLLESRYDEIRMFDYPMDDAEVASLYEKNEAPTAPAHRGHGIEPEAAERLLALYGDLDAMELPVVKANKWPLPMRQSIVESCTDEQIPVGFVMDGRYELAWPTPYRLFTFVLGDADFHGEDILVKLAPGEKPNYIAFEGTLSGLDVRRTSLRARLVKEQVTNLPGYGPQSEPDVEPFIALEDYKPFFYGQALDLAGSDQFHIPLVKETGLPEDLEGSVTMPLTGPARIHEIQLWEVGRQREPKHYAINRVSEYLSAPVGTDTIPRYGNALEKLKGGRHRTIIPSLPDAGSVSHFTLAPLQTVTLMSSAGFADFVYTVGFRLNIMPRGEFDVVWVKLRDPGNPSRIWAQTCVRVQYARKGEVQNVGVDLDIVDLALAPEDRLLVEVTFAQGGTLVLGGSENPSSLFAAPTNRKDTLPEYTTHALLPARMQYMKEYNYRPWLFTGNTITVDDWEVFGGPYDMAYPPLAVLRNDPDNELAKRYKTLLFDRSWFGRIEDGDPERPLRFTPPDGAPAWANAQRELLALNWDVVDWIVGQQRHNGMFWGGPNDDSFIPLGWAALPFLGHEGARKAWLRFYDGMEDFGIYHDGYCDIWPIDPLHITDFICSRGLMLSYDLGNPQVFERELRTAERYHERVTAANEKRAKAGLPPLTGDRAMRDDPNTGLIDQMDSEIYVHSRAHVGWWWGETETRPPHSITDRNAVAEQMLQAVKEVDDTAVFGMTEARVHTDNQRGFGRDILINTALGGRVQGYTEPFPPSIAVSWEDADTPEFARLVSYADESKLVVNCYSFLKDGLSTTMRVWRLTPGNYELEVGADANDDGQIDGAPIRKETVAIDHFSKISLPLRGKENTVVSLTLVEPLERPKQLPDLAISFEDVLSDGLKVDVTVHNIGGVAAENVRVAFVNPSGDVLSEQTIPYLESPRETLAAQRVTVTLPLEDREVHIAVDPFHEILESSEENNWVGFTIPKGKSEAVLADVVAATDAQMEEAIQHIRMLDAALATYKERYGRFPSRLQGLLQTPDHFAVLEGGVIPQAPWGEPYEYMVARHGREAIVRCWSPDGMFISNTSGLF